VAKLLGFFTLPPNSEESIHCEFTLVKGGFPAANMAVQRTLYDHIGGFDNDIPYGGEDHDLCARIYKAGYCIKTLTNAVVLHNHRTGLRGLIKQSYAYGKSHALSLRSSVPGAFICQAPMMDIQRIQPGSRVWIDVNQADKKMLVALLAGGLWTPLWVLPLAYFLYLCASIFRRSKQAGSPIRIHESPLCASLLLLKSASMTTGRLFGSLHHGVLCI
jgi:hypothetical protein